MVSLTKWLDQVVKRKLARDEDREGTRLRILEAARRCLVEEGYAHLSTRRISTEAGVNHALIHYYFGTKDELVVAVLDEDNRRLLARQSAMYETPGGFAEKWAQACAFYEDDLASGFVRLQAELWAASFSNPALRGVMLPRILAWRQVVRTAALAAVEHYELELPVSPEAIADWIATYWAGMEFEMLLGIAEEDGHFQLALDTMHDLLKRLDQTVIRQRPSSQAGIAPAFSARDPDGIS